MPDDDDPSFAGAPSDSSLWTMSGGHSGHWVVVVGGGADPSFGKPVCFKLLLN